MMIQGQMDLIRVSYFIVLLIFLFTTKTTSFEYRKAAEEAFFSKLVDPATGEVDEEMAEQLWISCRLDLIHLKEANEELKFCFPKGTCGWTDEIGSKSRSLAKENTQKLFDFLQPQLRKTLLDCVRKKYLQVPVSGDNTGLWTRYGKNLEPVFPRLHAPKRILLQSIAASPAPSPSPAAESPSFSLSPSRYLDPSDDVSPSPSEFSNAPSTELGSQSHFFPSEDPPEPSLPPKSDARYSLGPSSGSNANADKNKSSRKTVVIAVVVTAAVTFLVAAFLFLCCSRVCRTGSGVKRNDERPLLSLSLSDYSVGSSPMSFALGNSIKEQKLGHQSFVNNSIYTIDENFSLGDSGAAKHSAESFGTSGIGAQLPPPPGRVVSASSGLPTLKPPPGKAEPLPPEPRASLKPPRSMDSPSPPPPPAAAAVSPPTLKRLGNTGPTPPGPPPPPPIPPGAKPSSRLPPPPPKGGIAPPGPPKPMALGSKVPRPPVGLKHSSNTGDSEGAGSGGDDGSKAKLKPFFWDKVLANPDQSMVWHQIKSGSFQFNEEMIETLFGYTPADKNKGGRKKESSSQDPSPQYIQILDKKKAQNLSILLRALNVTIEEVHDALQEGNELPAELLQTLLKMAPTADEELKLRLFSGELSQLGPAERFLKAMVEIPFAFKRMEALLFMGTLQEDVNMTKESFETLEVACKELRSNRLFLKLLEAVLKTGNRMNDGTFRGGAQAFKLDTLLKLADVKGVDGKTTLLHFVVEEITRSEGLKAVRLARENQSLSSIKTDDLLDETTDETEEYYRDLGLQVVSGLSSELKNVKKASVIDADGLTGTVAKIGQALLKTRDFLNKDMKSIEEENGFHQTLKSFVQNAEVDVMWLLEEEKRIMALVKSAGDYFHGNAAKDEGLRLFVIVRDFLIILEKVCKEVRASQNKEKLPKKTSQTAPTSSNPHQQPSPDPRQHLFPAIIDRRMDFSSSSDDES